VGFVVVAGATGFVAGATGFVAGATGFVAGATGAATVCSTDVFDFLGIFFVLY
jgi:hypothetical protein